jgi:NAD(P)-dependent dehydrogenase (short-subunit alcohol dehydrogenase family)
VRPSIDSLKREIDNEQPKSKVFVITGGAGGIRRATAQALARGGGRVVIADVDQDAGTRTVREVAAATVGEPRLEPLDVTDSGAVDALAQKLEEEGWPVYGLMANAGIAPPSPATEYTDEFWNKTVAINLNGVFWCCRSRTRRARDAAIPGLGGAAPCGGRRTGPLVRTAPVGGGTPRRTRPRSGPDRSRDLAPSWMADSDEVPRVKIRAS